MRISKSKIIEGTVALVLVMVGISLRLLPHPPNFTPIVAIALFGGVYLSRKIAFVLPVVAMMISDIFIGSYEISLTLSVYGSFLVMVGIGFWVRKHKKWSTIGGSAIISAVLFFIITNLAVWVFTPWYPKTLGGLVQCFLLAFPFFRNTLSSTLFYTPIFFGIYELIDLWIKKKFEVPQLKVIKNE